MPIQTASDRLDLKAPAASPSSAEVRNQVLLRIAEVMRDASNQGLDAYKTAERCFPGTPDVVLIDAMMLESEWRTEAWWKSVERTIDAAVVDAALVQTGARS